MNKLVSYYLNNKDKIYGFTLKLCSYNHEKAESLVADALLKILEKDTKHDELKASETTLLCIIIKNMFLDNYGRKRENFDKVELHEYNGFVNTEIGLDLSIIEKQISKLTIRHKSVIDLHIKGFVYNEIAEILDIPVGTVKGDLFRIRTILKKKLTRLGFEINY